MTKIDPLSAGPSSVDECSFVHQCQLVTEDYPSVRVVRIAGHLDWMTSGRFHDLLCEDCTPSAVVIDFGGTSTIDSAGTGTLLACTARAHERGQQLVVVSSDPALLELFESQGLGTVVPIVASEADAWQWLGTQKVDAGTR